MPLSFYDEGKTLMGKVGNSTVMVKLFDVDMESMGL